MHIHVNSRKVRDIFSTTNSTMGVVAEKYEQSMVISPSKSLVVEYFMD